MKAIGGILCVFIAVSWFAMTASADEAKYSKCVAEKLAEIGVSVASGDIWGALAGLANTIKESIVHKCDRFLTPEKKQRRAERNEYYRHDESTLCARKPKVC